MALPPNSHGVDQREEGHAAGGHASEVEAISSAVSPSMTARRRSGLAKRSGEQIEPGEGRLSGGSTPAGRCAGFPGWGSSVAPDPGKCGSSTTAVRPPSMAML